MSSWSSVMSPGVPPTGFSEMTTEDRPSTWWARRLDHPPGMAFKWQRFLVGGPAIGLSTLCGLTGALLSASAANGAYDSAASIVFFSLFAAGIAGAWYAFLASPIFVGVARRYYRGQ